MAQVAGRRDHESAAEQVELEHWIDALATSAGRIVTFGDAGLIIESRVAARAGRPPVEHYATSEHAIDAALLAAAPIDARVLVAPGFPMDQRERALVADR